MARIPFGSISLETQQEGASEEFQIINNSLRLKLSAGGRSFILRNQPRSGSIAIKRPKILRLQEALENSAKPILRTTLANSNGSDGNFTNSSSTLSLTETIKTRTRLNSSDLLTTSRFVSALRQTSRAFLGNPGINPNQLTPAQPDPNPTPDPDPSPTPTPPTPAPTPSDSGGGGGSSTSSFLLNIDTINNEITFGGSATGSISLTGTTGTTSTFTRQGLAQTTTQQLSLFTILLSSTNNDINASTYNDTTNLTGIKVLGSTTNDAILGSLQADSLVGGDGDDTITTGTGIDTVNAGNGNDTISSSGGTGVFASSQLTGGNGNDLFIVTNGFANLPDFSYSSGNSDSVNTTGGRTRIPILEGNTFTASATNVVNTGGILEFDVRSVSAGITTTVDLSLAGGTSGYVLSAGGISGDTVLTGSSRNDEIYGFNGDDVLSGGTGNDTISGGAGDDVITGGAGDDRVITGNFNDTVVFGGSGSLGAVTGSVSEVSANLGTDTITDYNVATDSIRLSQASFGATSTGAVGSLAGAKFSSVANASTAVNVDYSTGGFVYNSATGDLVYTTADMTNPATDTLTEVLAANSGTIIGLFTGAPALTVTEFSVVA